MFKSHYLSWTLLILFSLILHVRADYTIDDGDYSILKFSENPAGPVWGPFGSDTGEELEIRLPNGTMQTINSAQCYDGTFTYAACSTSDNCAVQFSFTGSGITIYVLQAGPQGMSASLSIDGGTATTASLPAPPAPQYNIPHVTLFSVQNIPSGTHSAIMTVLDWNGGFSGMMLDYVDVNQAVVAAPSPSPSPSPSPAPASPSPAPTTSAAAPAPSPTSASPSPSLSTAPSPSAAGSTSASSATPFATSGTGTPALPSSGSVVESIQSSQMSTAASPGATSDGSNGTSSTPSSGAKKTNVGAIVGGVVGGVVGLLALGALAFFCYRRRRQRSQSLDERPSPLLTPGPDPRFTNVTGRSAATPFSVVPVSAAAPLSRPSGVGGSRPIQAWTESDATSTSNLVTTAAAGRAHTTASSPTNLTHMAVTSPTSVPRSVSRASVDDWARENVSASAGADVPSTQGPSQGPGIRPLPLPTPTSYPNEKAGQVTLTTDALTSPQPPFAQGTTAAPRTNHPTLTDDQADFVNSLFNNNVPAPVVARVLERMLANPQEAGTAGGGNTGPNDPELRSHMGAWLGGRWSGIGDGETTIGTAPPSYDFVHAQ